MSVREAQERIDSREFAEWMAFAQIEGPFWDQRGDYQAAIIAATVANALSGRRGKRYKPEDFLPRWKPRKPGPAQTWQEQLKFIEELNRALGGRDERARIQRGVISEEDL